MIEMGMPKNVALTAIRLHLLPQVSLYVRGHYITLSERCRDLLTGSKTAGLLATLPIADAVRKNSKIVASIGITYDESMNRRIASDPLAMYGSKHQYSISFSQSFSIRNWADNLYIVSYVP
jgi:hypothetical protein